MNYFKLTRFLQHGDTSNLDVPVEQQINYISFLGEPTDDIDRSYKQYLCQRFFVPRWKKLILDALAALLFWPTFLLLIIKGLFSHEKEKLDVYASFWGIEEVLPDELKKIYNIEIRNWKENKALFLCDIKPILKLLFRHPLSPLFVLKNVMKLAIYSYIINCYKPRAIIVHNEPSFTTSFLTMCCNDYGVKHINVMHGEKLYNIRDSYFRFDCFYVWSDYYIKLFETLYVESTQMIVSVPHSLKIDIVKYTNPKAYSDFKYYLAIYNEEEIKSILSSMQFTKKMGKTVKYRPHPRYSDIILLKKYIDDSEIEWPQEVSILESVSNVSYAVGSYTTVLSQAYFSGKGVILDDMTFCEQYNHLKSYKYILSNKGLPTLSQYQEQQE